MELVFIIAQGGLNPSFEKRKQIKTQAGIIRQSNIGLEFVLEYLWACGKEMRRSIPLPPGYPLQVLPRSKTLHYNWPGAV
jgi:hypothetical protein